MMAASERRLPSPEAFVGQSWSSWIERAEALRLSDESEDNGKDVRKKIETMRLIREDMPIFGHCPAHDEFFLVVCNQCGQVVKPQAFQMHCERRHGSLNKLSARRPPALNSPNSIVLQKSRSNSVQTAVTSNHGTSSSKEKLQSPGSKVLQLDVPSKGPKENLCLFVPVVNLEKIPTLRKTDSSCIKLSSKLPAVSLSPPNPTLAPSKPSPVSVVEPVAKALAASAIPKVADCLQPSTVIQNGKGERSPVLEEPTLSNRKNSHKIHRRIVEKESDLNKHCSVMDPDTKKHCTRSLSCKTHSLTQRRSVLGRHLAFDELLAEHRASLKNKETGKERKLQAKETVPLSLGQEAAPGPVMLGISPNRPKLATCSGARVFLQSDLIENEKPSDPVPHPELPYPLFRFEINSRLSSEESDGEMTEEAEKLDCHYSRFHPKPLAFCTFGSRMISRGCYVFNRRFDRFRMALNSMVEKHLNSQMWRKIPPATDPQSTPLAAPTPAPSALSLPSISSISGSLSASASSPGVELKAASLPVSLVGARGPPEPPSACCRALPPLTPPARIPSPSLSRSPWAKSSRAPGIHLEPGPIGDTSLSKHKKPGPASCNPPPPSDSPLKRNCVLSLDRISAAPPGGTALHPPHSNTSSHRVSNGLGAHGPKAGRSGSTAILGLSGNSLKGNGRTVEQFGPKKEARLCAALNPASPPQPPTSPARTEGRKRKNAASCSKPTKIAKGPDVSGVQRKREESLATTRPHSNSHPHKAKVRP
ncbi:ataxin-7-like protein 1 isoform X2 [Chiloscyllium punctatum]|uniref:ataxin-7-like protein 1 isoform X2 n=1 Tax=Chiloscyllium punctatum TaxID=137246 RepID=UPI003B637964